MKETYKNPEVVVREVNLETPMLVVSGTIDNADWDD